MNNQCFLMSEQIWLISKAQHNALVFIYGIHHQFLLFFVIKLRKIFALKFIYKFALYNFMNFRITSEQAQITKLCKSQENYCTLLPKLTEAVKRTDIPTLVLSLNHLIAMIRQRRTHYAPTQQQQCFSHLFSAISHKLQFLGCYLQLVAPNMEQLIELQGKILNEQASKLVEVNQEANEFNENKIDKALLRILETICSQRKVSIPFVLRNRADFCYLVCQIRANYQNLKRNSSQYLENLNQDEINDFFVSAASRVREAQVDRNQVNKQNKIKNCCLFEGDKESLKIYKDILGMGSQTQNKFIIHEQEQEQNNHVWTIEHETIFEQMEKIIRRNQIRKNNGNRVKLVAADTCVEVMGDMRKEVMEDLQTSLYYSLQQRVKGEAFSQGQFPYHSKCSWLLKFSSLTKINPILTRELWLISSKILFYSS